MDIQRARAELHWSPKTPLDSGLMRTVAWHRANADWWLPLLCESERVATQLYKS